MPIVSNIPNTSGEKCRCESWIDHWKQGAEKEALFCAEINCNERYDLVGAHVYRHSPNSGKEEFIIPLCKGHNNIPPGEYFQVKNVDFISANVDNTCGHTRVEYRF